jgi:hypothetical protein
MPASETYEERVLRWEDTASRLLVGRTITRVRYLTRGELAVKGWNNACVVLELDDGTILFPSMDDEGNNGGALFTNIAACDAFPVIRHYEHT